MQEGKSTKYWFVVSTVDRYSGGKCVFVWFLVSGAISVLKLQDARRVELVPGRDLPEGGVLIYLVGQDGRPEHLEEVLASVQLRAKLHSHEMVGDFLHKIDDHWLDHI